MVAAKKPGPFEALLFRYRTLYGAVMKRGHLLLPVYRIVCKTRADDAQPV